MKETVFVDRTMAADMWTHVIHKMWRCGAASGPHILPRLVLPPYNSSSPIR